RHSLSLDQRRALRRWANSQTIRPSHKACMEWFASQYGQTISQSTVSHSLSPKYARLDGDPQLSGSRLRFGNWPDVEKLVLMWHHSMVNTGRQPSNEELADKAKSIFQQLPRYKDEQAPEFSPGWIHRFKKRYGLLIRRQRRHGNAAPSQDDLPYLVDTVPRLMNVSANTSLAAIRETINRIIGAQPSLTICSRVRHEIVRRLNHQINHNGQPNQAHLPLDAADPHHATDHSMDGGEHHYGEDDDPEIMLQNALHALQQEEADVEAHAAEERESRERTERGISSLAPPLSASGLTYAQHAAAGALATPVKNGVAAPNQPHEDRFTPVGGGAEDLNLTPIPSNGPISSTDRPQRCPFCINQRMLRTIKEAIEHMATHVVV
ncbi:CenpB-DNA-bind-domain-containing protein, partial [Cryphonectria parasitica EP155]